MSESEKRPFLQFVRIEPGTPWQLAREKPPLVRAGDSLRALTRWPHEEWMEPRTYKVYAFRRCFLFAIYRRRPK